MAVFVENVEINETISNISHNIYGVFGIAYYDKNEGMVVDNTTYTVKLALSIALGISMVLSVIGNVCTCAVIAQDRTMRTPTNCYLANLAITDLLTVLFVPIDIYIIWMPDFYPLGEVGCRLHFILLDVLSNCSLLIITAFTVERYIVVTRPFLRQKMLMNSRVFKIVGVIWAISLSFCLPDIFYIELLERKEYVFCYYTLSYLKSILMGVEIFIFFIIPMTTVIVLYVLIALELKAAHSKLRSSPVNAKQNRDKAVKMLAAVAASFFFFWSPYCVMRMMMIYPNFQYEDNHTAWKIVNYLCYNGYISTAVNPILYSLMSRKFRQAFKDFLKGRRTLRRNANKKKRNSTL
ncbi:neuromedin-U receptor 2-like [Anticarsia gemmatalis]|uniref:neuromedin-U receptor 2-like n=1 Tax=Anticarsia gemmatalis TaxID=129554 RepID=UPI003F772A8E